MKSAAGGMRPRSARSGSLKFRVLDWFITLAISAAAAVVLLFVIFAPVSIKSSGVYGFLEGDLVFADRLGKYVFGLERGDAVVASVDEAAGFGRIKGKNTAHIARVIAFSGESVTIAGGRVYIDDSLLDEAAYAGLFDDALRIKLIVPTGSMLLMPDERGTLTEENVKALLVPIEKITGEVRFTAFPFARLGIFK